MIAVASSADLLDYKGGPLDDALIDSAYRYLE